MAVDVLGQVIAVTVPTASIHDNAAAGVALLGWGAPAKTGGTPHLRDALRHRRILPVIPRKGPRT
ncbi:hypothetical protein ACFWCB_11025 [Streptomyces sp. NPDC060048]|uniref:hypothetical protein n=1 Tax=unclassified Streptomyces TaxID=2593676 RepID=UPI00368B56C6